jgi:hypothetical protein
MYGGGMVQKGYQTGGMVTGDPRMIAYNMANYASSIPENRTASFNVGGVVAPMTQEGFMQQGQQGSQFQLPRSIFAPSAPAQPATAPTTPVTLYGPTGDVIVLMIPTDQEQYNQLIAQGYTTEPRPTEAPADAGGRDDGPIGIDEPEVTTGGGFRLNDENLEALRNNPLSFGSEALQGGALGGFSSRQMTGAGGLLGGMPGAVIGGLAGAALELDNVAKATAALEIARAQNLGGTEAFTKLETDLKTAKSNLSPGARMLQAVGFGTGNNYVEQARAETATAATTASGTTRSSGTRAPAVVGTTSRPSTDPFAGMSGQDLLPPARDSDSSDTVFAPTSSSRPTSRPDDSQLSTAGQTSRAAATAANEATRDARNSAYATDRDPREVGPMAKGGLVAKRKKPVAKKK